MVIMIAQQDHYRTKKKYKQLDFWRGALGLEPSRIAGSAASILSDNIRLGKK